MCICFIKLPRMKNFPWKNYSERSFESLLCCRHSEALSLWVTTVWYLVWRVIITSCLLLKVAARVQVELSPPKYQSAPLTAILGQSYRFRTALVSAGRRDSLSTFPVGWVFFCTSYKIFKGDAACCKRGRDVRSIFPLSLPHKRIVMKGHQDHHQPTDRLLKWS